MSKQKGVAVTYQSRVRTMMEKEAREGPPQQRARLSYAEAREIMDVTARVAARGFAVGAALHVGKGVLSGIVSRKLFQQRFAYVGSLASRDMIRFAVFVAASGASYKAVVKFLEKIMHRENEPSSSNWWIPVAGGFAAGLTSVIDEPHRRRSILLYVMARAVGTLVKTLHSRGLLPTVPHLSFLVYSVCHAFIMVCMVHYPELLPPAYYNSIIRWGQTYTDEKIRLYFREPGSEFVPCSVLMHKGSCESSAFFGFFSHWFLYLKLYTVLYIIPLLLFRLKQVLSNPVGSLQIVGKGIVRSALYFAVDATLFKYAMCVLRNLNHRPPPIAHYIPVLSSIIGSLGILVEQPSRRIELLHFILPQIFYAIWKILCITKPLGLERIPFGSVWLFCLSLVVMMYSHTHNREAVAPFINRAFDFLLKD